MVKLDVTILRYLSKDELRVLTAVELGMKNHELVPSELIASISGLKRGTSQKALTVLCKNKLIVHDGKFYDGFKLTYRGYDYLSLRTLCQRGVIRSIGRQIGVGKESDIFIAEHVPADTDIIPPSPACSSTTIEFEPSSFLQTKNQHDVDNDNDDDEDDDDEDEDSSDDDDVESKAQQPSAESDPAWLQLFSEMSTKRGASLQAPPMVVVIKFHRLGRISFRAIKEKRDYLEHRKSASWLYLSRLAALKEFAYMKVLYEHGFPVPRPLDVNRHCIVMELVEGYPLCQVKHMVHPAKVYSECMNLIVRLALCGLIHCDFNEFNLLISEKEEVTMIDFPQMVSISHFNAREYFDRDVQCIRTFFKRRFDFDATQWPTFDHVTQTLAKKKALDVLVEASGFTKSDVHGLLDMPLETNTNDDDEDDEDDNDEKQPLPSVESLEDRLRRQLGIQDLATTADGMAIVPGASLPRVSFAEPSSSSHQPQRDDDDDLSEGSKLDRLRLRRDGSESDKDGTSDESDEGDEDSKEEEEEGEGTPKKYTDHIGSRSKRRREKRAALLQKDPEYIKNRIKAALAKKNKIRRGKTNSTKNATKRNNRTIIREMK